MQTTNQGFTLTELLITVAIVGIVASVAIPGLRDFITATRISSQANDFLAAIAFARSEAVKRNTTITLCPSPDGSTCSSNWSAGWIVRQGSSGTVVRVYPALNGQNTMSSTGGHASIVFLAGGQIQQADTFNLCSANANDHQSREIQLTITGRVSTSTSGSCSY